MWQYTHAVGRNRFARQKTGFFVRYTSKSKERCVVALDGNTQYSYKPTIEIWGNPPKLTAAQEGNKT